MTDLMSPTTGRYCNFCTKKLQLPYFDEVLDASGTLVRVHKACAEEAKHFWHGPYPSAQERVSA